MARSAEGSAIDLGEIAEDLEHAELMSHLSDEQWRTLIWGVLTRIARDSHNASVQATETNGRVRALEMWRAYLAGAVAVIVLIVAPVLVALVIAEVGR